MQNICCDLCSNSDSRLLFYENNYAVVRCIGCGLAFVKDRPSSKELEAFYSAFHLNETSIIDVERYTKGEMFHRVIANKSLGYLLRHVQSGRLLDVGCGAGFFLDEAWRRGFQVTGLELSKPFADFANRLLEGHGRVWYTELDKTPWEECSFEIIALQDVIGHLPSPRAFFTRAHALLVDGGILFLKLGNQGEVDSQQEFGGPWEVPAHLYFLTKETIKHYLTACGFQLVSLYTEPLVESRFSFEVFRYSCGRSARRDTIKRLISFVPGAPWAIRTLARLRRTPDPRLETLWVVARAVRRGIEGSTLPVP